MKKILTLLSLAALTAGAQVQYVDLTTRTTNTITSTALITIPGFCTNAPYVVSNTLSITTGDPLATAFGKVNANFNYVSNQLGQAFQLPNQINTNLNAYLTLISNTTATVNSALTNDSAGHGGLTLHLKASDTGGDMYLHMDSNTNITGSASP